MPTNAQVNVQLTGDASSLRAALGTAGREFLSFKNTLKAGFGLNLGAQMANGILGLGSAMTEGIRSATAFAGELTDMSRAADLSVESFQVLARSAKLSGAEMADVSKAVVTIGEKTRDALAGNGGAAQAFAQLGINVSAFTKLAPERQVEALGAALVGAKDPAAAFSAVMELLGAKTAPKLRAMLESLGTEGLDKLAADMARTGLLMREDTVAALDQAGDKSEDNATRFKVAWGNVAVALEPAFEGLRVLGTWLADLLSWVLLRIEKIAIAASTLASMMVDLGTGDFKGLDFYNDEANRLSAEAEERAKKRKDGRPLVETKRKPPPGEDSQIFAKDDLKAISDRVETSQRKAAKDLAHLGRDFSKTNEEKRRLTRMILQREAEEILAAQKDLDALIERLAKADPRFAALQGKYPDNSAIDLGAELSKGPAANKELATAFEQRERLAKAREQIDEQALDHDTQPKTVVGGVQAAMATLENQWGTLAEQMRDSFVNIGQTITSSVGGALQQVLGTTEFWSQKLGNIAGPIMGSITQSIARMAAEFITGELLVAGIRKMIGAQKSAENKKEVAESATAAGFKSIAQLGPIFGPLAFAAAAAAIVGMAGGFYQGGFTGLGNPHQPAGIVHKGEFVFPHDVTAAIGPRALEGIVDSVRNTSSFPSGAIAGVASAGGGPTPRVLLVDYREKDLIARTVADPRFNTTVRHIGRRNPGDFGSPT